LPTAPFILASSGTRRCARAPCQARQHVGDLLAHRGGAGGLAVRAAEHGHRGQPPPCAAAGQHAVQRRQQHLLARGLQHQRVAGVVDVLAGAGEVHELGGGSSSAWPLKALLDPVLHRLDVVVGGLLDVLDGLRVGLAETQHQAAQQAARGSDSGANSAKAGVGQRDEPLHLDLHAAVHQAELRQQRAQRRQPCGVAAVQRRQGGPSPTPGAPATCPPCSRCAMGACPGPRSTACTA
jgi:hypothetical protein